MCESSLCAGLTTHSVSEEPLICGGFGAVILVVWLRLMLANVHHLSDTQKSGIFTGVNVNKSDKGDIKNIEQTCTTFMG